VLPDDGEFGGPAGGEIGGDGRDPRGRGGRDRLEQDLDDAVATETDAPDEVVLRRSVVGDKLRPAGGGDTLGAGEDVFFETAAADGAKAFAGGGDEETGAGAPVRGAGDSDEGGEDGVGQARTRPGECGELGLKIVHRVGNYRAKTRENGPLDPSISGILSGGK